MYVSVMDGRFPTEEDYDYKSVNLGADWVVISSNDTSLKNENMHSWNPRVGMVVVIGIKARYNGASAYSLVLKGPNPTFYEIEDMATDVYKEVRFAADESRSESNPHWHIFKWYNWYHEDFELSVKMQETRNNLRRGKGNFFLNAIGETYYEENAISGIPIAPENSMWYAELDISEGLSTESVKIYKYDTDVYPMFCYNCWYYLTIKITDPEETKIRAIF